MTDHDDRTPEEKLADLEAESPSRIAGTRRTRSDTRRP
jgi:hypothetical protein